MGRRATNVVAFNDQAIRKVVKEATGKPRRELRVIGVDRLVLITHPTGAGTFTLIYTSPAGERRKLRLGEYHPQTFPLHAARTRAIEALAKINRGVDPVTEAEAEAKQAEARANAMTFKVLAEKFLTENTALAAGTCRVYRHCFEKDAYPVIGALPADEVTADHIVDICKSIEASGVTTKADHVKTAIGGAYRWAVRQRLVKMNPCAGLGRRAPLMARTRTPTDAELATLWATVERPEGKLTPAMRLIIQLAILTGQRRKEIAGARLSELHGLDSDAPMWVIPGDVNKRGKIIRGRTKNGREQHVPLSKQAASLLLNAIALAGSSPFVFPSDLGKVKIGREPRAPHINESSVSMAMWRLRATTGIDDITVHDMRRAISNWLKNEGWPREVRDLILNHKDGSVTEAHYSATARMEKQVRRALQAWADHVWSITGQGKPASNVVSLAVARA